MEQPRCVTEYYITPSLHTHGARHSHTRGGQPAHAHTRARTTTTQCREGHGRQPWGLGSWVGAGVALESQQPRAPGTGPWVPQSAPASVLPWGGGSPAPVTAAPYSGPVSTKCQHLAHSTSRSTHLAPTIPQHHTHTQPPHTQPPPSLCHSQPWRPHPQSPTPEPLLGSLDPHGAPGSQVLEPKNQVFLPWALEGLGRCSKPRLLGFAVAQGLRPGCERRGRSSLQARLPQENPRSCLWEARQRVEVKLAPARTLICYS